MARGRETISQRIALEGGKEIQEQLKALGQTGEKAFGQIKDAADKVGGVGGQIGKSVDEAQKSMARAREAAGQLRNSLSDVSAAFRTVSANVAVAAAAFAGIAGGLAAMAKSGAEAADAAGKTAASIGMTVREYGRLQFAAEQSGVKAEQFMSSISRLNQEIEKTKDSTDVSKTALGKLGIAVTEAGGKLRPTEAIMEDVAEAFRKMPDGAEKSATAIALFGRMAGPRLIPLLNEGRAGIRAMGADAEALGLVFTDQQVKIGTAMNDALSRSARAMKAVQDQIGLLFAPVVTEAADAFTEAIRANRDTLIALGKAVVDYVSPIIRDFVNLLTGQDDKVQSGWILALRDAVVGLGTVFQSAFQEVILPTMRELVGITNALLWPINQIFGGKISGEAVLMAIAIGRLTGAFWLVTAAVRACVAAFVLLQATTLVGALTSIGAAFAGIVSWIRGAILAVGLWMAASGGWAGALGALRVAIAAVGTAMLGWPAVIATLVASVAWLLVELWKIDWMGFATKGTQAWEALKQGAAGVWSAIVADFQLGLDQLRELASNFSGNFGDLWTAIGQGFRSMWQAVVADFMSGVDQIKSIIDTVAGWIRDLASSIASAVSSAASAMSGNAQGGFATPAFSRGGRVWGAGTSTSDSIPARLSRGEFVIRAEAVRHYGPQLFDLLNSMRLARDNFRGFAAGGLVDGLRASLASLAPVGPGYAAGGLAAATAGSSAGGRVVNLTIDGQTFSGLIAPEETAEQLTRFALGKQIRSAGRKPNWYGGGR